MMETVQRIGKTYPPLLEKTKKFTYVMMETDANGWVDVNNYLPEDYDLIYMKDAEGKRTVVGWLGANQWDGLNLPTNFKCKYWKRKEDN